MSDSIDRMRARREALYGDTPSLFAPGELQLRAPTMDFKSTAPSSSNPNSFASAVPAIEPTRHKESYAPAKESFFSRNVPVVNLPLWGVLFGGIGILALGVGVYKTVSASKARR